MKAEELLKKLNKLDSIYDLVNAEIEAYDVDIKKRIYENWTKRKQKIQTNLISQFKKEVCKKQREALEYFIKYQNDLRNWGLITTKIEDALKID